MKRLFTLLFTLCIAAVASAQMEQAIIIDQSTFRAIKSGSLSGVNIDPIGLDSSRRPCARIKMKVNRMTREEIDGLQIKIRTNNECIKCKSADYDNGLIIEMTAKSESRFYLHHDKFGESNEVTLNLEADKEYYIEASLNQQFSVNILSNVENADVYIDNTFFGKTNKDGILTCEGLLAGEHSLKLVYSGVDYNQNIVVSSANIYFIQNVDIKSTSSQYLIIKTTPSNALVEINGEVVENSQNGASKILKPGVFTYTVTANNYHPKSGVGTMRGEKIVIPVELDPAFGYIAINADSEYNGAQVYVNNSLRGTLPLDKNIIQLSGDCSVRIVKSLYKTFEKNIKITDG
ncbi:MAG: PEGA domain-containing protein, partial [Alistipes sp.]|nr:PEGA domain-containing protein [Alistipes sp.]